MWESMAVAMSLIVFFSLLLPWFQMTPKGAGENSSISVGYPELYYSVQKYIMANVSKSLTENVHQSQLHKEDGSLTTLGRLYSLIPDFAGALVSPVMFGALAGLFDRKGHALGLLGMLVFTWGVYGLGDAYYMSVSPQPAYFIAFLTFLVGLIMGGSGGSRPKRSGTGSGK